MRLDVVQVLERASGNHVTGREVARGLKNRHLVEIEFIETHRGRIPERIIVVHPVDLRGLEHALAAHHPDVGPGNRQDARAAPGRRRNGGIARARAADIDESVARQVRREVSTDADRPDAGSAAAVRDAEGLVQVQVRNVGAELAGRGAGTIATLMPWPSVGPLAIGIGATLDRLSSRSDFLRQTLLREVSNFAMSHTAEAAE